MTYSTPLHILQIAHRRLMASTASARTDASATPIMTGPVSLAMASLARLRHHFAILRSVVTKAIASTRAALVPNSVMAAGCEIAPSRVHAAKNRKLDRGYFHHLFINEKGPAPFSPAPCLGAA